MVEIFQVVWPESRKVTRKLEWNNENFLKMLAQKKQETLQHLHDLQQPDEGTVTFPTMDALSGEKCTAPKLQFRAKKKKKEESPPAPNDVRKPKSILKMAPPSNLPLPPKRNGSSGKSVKIGGSISGPIKSLSKGVYMVPAF